MALLASFVRAHASQLSQTSQPAEISWGNYIVRQFQTDTGLPENTITALAQTPDGYIWCATFSGLARFDGLRFEVFDPGNTPELPTDRIVKLGASKNGSLVMVTEFNDVIIRENGKFKRKNLRHYRNNGFAEDSAGRIWTLYIDGPRPFWQLLSGDSDSVFEGEIDVRSIMRPVGVWVQPGGAVFYAEPPTVRKWTTNHWTNLDLFHDPTEKLARILAQGSNAWIRTDKALYLFDGTSVHYRLPTVADSPTADVVEDNDGNVWAAYANGRLFHFDLKNGLQEEIRGLPGGAQAEIRATLIDHEGNLWVGFANRGLALVRRKSMRVFGVNEGLANPIVRSVPADLDGNVWICTLAGVNVLSGDQLSTAPIPFDQYFAWNVAPAGPGGVWLASYDNGLYRHNRDKALRVGGDMTDKWAAPDFTCLFTDSKGSLWFGNNAGLFCFDGTNAQSIALPVKRSVDIRVVAEGNDGAMYVGSNGGGFFARDSTVTTWKQFRRADGLESEQVYSLHADRHQTT